MAVTSFDLAVESLTALTTTSSYREWARSRGADVEAGLAGLGFFDKTHGLDASIAMVNRHRRRIEEFVASGSWRSRIEGAIGDALVLLRPAQPDVRVYTLVGPARSNGSATRFDG